MCRTPRLLGSSGRGAWHAQHHSEADEDDILAAVALTEMATAKRGATLASAQQPCCEGDEAEGAPGGTPAMAPQLATAPFRPPTTCCTPPKPSTAPVPPWDRASPPFSAQGLSVCPGMFGRMLTRSLRAVPASSKLLARQDAAMLLEATPHEGGAMHTPSIAPMGGSPGLPVSPLMAGDAVLFTPSSRKLLRSMAHNPFDMPLDMPTGLTPPCGLHQTPAGGVEGGDVTAAAPCSGKRSKAAADAFDTPVRGGQSCDRDKPTATRRLVFGQGADAEAQGDQRAAPSGADVEMPPAVAALASVEAAPIVAAPAPTFESPLKRSRVQPTAEGVARGPRPLFVAAAGETPASVCLPETPGQDRTRTAQRCEAAATAARPAAAAAAGGGSTGRTSAASTLDAAQPSQDSTDTQDKSPGCGHALEAAEAVARDVHTDSLQLKSKLNSIVDAMFVC